MKKKYDQYLLDLDRGRITWWDYGVLVPSKQRPASLMNYWSYLKNRKAFKMAVKKAEWRVEAARKGISIH